MGCFTRRRDDLNRHVRVEAGPADCIEQVCGIAPQGFAVDWNEVIFKMLHIKGIYGREMYETWYKMIALVRGGLDLSGLITHRIGIDDYATGFADMISGDAGKVVMDW